MNISHMIKVGVYSSGPIWGRIVDTYGPRIPMVLAFVLLLLGYSGIKLIYDAGVPENSDTISLFTSCVLILCGFMTGAGGNAGLTGAVNSTAKTFPDKTRASATGLVISGFGLSAFLFSTVSRIHFPGNTSSFLGLLALGTSVPMIFGFVFVRPVPLPPSSSSEEYFSSEEETRVSRNHEDHEHDNYNEQEHEYDGEQSALLPLSSPLSQVQVSHVYPFPPLSPSKANRHTTPDINNAGIMSQALYIHSLQSGGGTQDYDPIQAARWQADQVSFISLLNFAGRILIAHFSENWGFLSIAPIILGNIFGVVFGRVLDAHDRTSFPASPSSPPSSSSESPTSATLTPRTPAPPSPSAITYTNNTTPAPAPAPPPETCTLGRTCYVDALYLTLTACLVGVVLSAWAARRDWRGRAALRRERCGMR
ncbi:hypothetical protein C0992_003667 [Termitomyces sp. T32_za158]|nr:hypothetical protein C0992_003667 [Termitomyces sp. T32_za158]